MTDRTHPDSGRIITSGDVIAELHGRIAELEAQLEAVGAGGVGPLVRADGFSAADMATAAAQGYRDGENHFRDATEMVNAQLKGQRAVLCDLLRECLPLIDALWDIPGTDDSDAHLQGLQNRINDALGAVAEERAQECRA